MQIGVTDVEISGPPACYEMEYQTLLTPEAVKFVVELVRQFDKDVDQVIMCFLLIHNLGGFKSCSLVAPGKSPAPSS